MPLVDLGSIQVETLGYSSDCLGTPVVVALELLLELILCGLRQMEPANLHVAINLSPNAMVKRHRGRSIALFRFILLRRILRAALYLACPLNFESRALVELVELALDALQDLVLLDQVVKLCFLAFCRMR